MLFLSGPHWPNLNTTLIPSIASHAPAGTSIHTVLHFVQIHQSGGFHSFDHGVSFELHIIHNFPHDFSRMEILCSLSKM